MLIISMAYYDVICEQILIVNCYVAKNGSFNEYRKKSCKTNYITNSMLQIIIFSPLWLDALLRNCMRLNS